MALTVKSQNIYDTFDYSTCSGNSPGCSFADNINSLINNQCLPYWNATHGTPNLFNNSIQINSPAFQNFIDLKGKLNGKTCLNMFYLGNGYPELNTCDYGSEGAFREFKFTKDKCYRIVFNVSLSGTKVFGDKYYLRMFAGKNLPVAQKYGAVLDRIPLVPSSNIESISDYDCSNFSFNSSTFSNFQQIEVHYRPTTNDFYEFWIYPDQYYTPGDHAQSIYAITDFKIEESCAQNINLNSENVFYSGNSKASEKITVGSQIPNVSFSYIENTEFVAGNSIEFLPNTELRKNSSVKYSLAFIQPCTVLSTACNSISNSVVSDNTFALRSAKVAENQKKNPISISPNPTNGILNIEIANETNEDVQIRVLNLTGQTIIFDKSKRSNFIIDLSSYPSGIYILQVKVNDNTTSHKINFI